MKSLDEALTIVLGDVATLPTLLVPCSESSGRWLQEDVTSDVDQPPADVSAMDGFALRAADLAATPTTLTVIGEVPAGVQPDFEVGTGQAARIMTGAILPEGADAVQMVEHTEADGERVRVLERVESGSHVRPRGENIVKGEVLLAAGQRIGPAEVGLLAGAGRPVVPVARSPRVAIVPTGDELVEPGVQPAPAQIRNSNGYSLHAQVREENGIPAYLGIGRDVDSALDRKIAEGLRHDVLLLCGGVSMGKYDLVTAALKRAGVALRFEKVAVKPGKPTVFGVHEHGETRTLVFGLPGNPVSGMVMFRLLVAPALRKMQGACKLVERGFPGRLSAALRPTMGRTCFHPVRVERADAGLVAHPVAHRGSGDLVAWREANAMIRLPAGQGAEAGELVDIFLQRDHELR